MDNPGPERFLRMINFYRKFLRGAVLLGDSCGVYECCPLSSQLSETYATAIQPIQLRGSFAGLQDIYFD